MIWNIHPEIFRVGSFGLRWYGVLFASGFIIGLQIMKIIFRRENKSEESLDQMLFMMIAGTVIGARLGHCLFYEPHIYLAQPWRILKVWEGGLASHGAVIGIISAMYLYARRNALSWLWVMDRVVIPICIGAFCIRLGNFFNSEIVGKPSDVPWAVVFSRIDSKPRHPAQLYEAFVYLSMFFVTWKLYQKERVRKSLGFLFGLVLTVFFSARILIEFVKENQVAFESALPMNMGQLLSVPVVIFGLWLMWSSKSRQDAQVAPSKAKKKRK